MKIVFFETEDWEKEIIKKELGKHKLIFFKEDLDEKNVSKVSDADILCVFIYSDIDRKILDKFKNLKAIVTKSTGFDHIDVKKCKERGILVFNVPHYGENTVAEHTFALILALAKNLMKSCDRTRKGNFSFEGLRGFDLMGKTLGIIGMGRIGGHVAKIANGFDMRVIASSPRRHKELEKKFGFKYVTLDYLLKNSDIITLHAPYNKETHHMLNSKNMMKIKKGAYLINAARGGLVDTRALLKALDKKILAGAGLDVLEEEELLKEKKHKGLTRKERESLIENHKLLKYCNVVITPHNAFNTKGALSRILNTTIENIKSVISGKIKKENLVG
jgi:D-lactate dehydrogenase